MFPVLPWHSLFLIQHVLRVTFPYLTAQQHSLFSDAHLRNDTRWPDMARVTPSHPRMLKTTGHFVLFSVLILFCWCMPAKRCYLRMRTPFSVTAVGHDSRIPLTVRFQKKSALATFDAHYWRVALSPENDTKTGPQAFPVQWLPRIRFQNSRTYSKAPYCVFGNGNGERKLPQSWPLIYENIQFLPFHFVHGISP